MRILAMLFAMILMTGGSCSASSPAPSENPGTDPPVVVDPGGNDGQVETPVDPQYTAYFDKYAAWDYLEAQVAFGFRVPGTTEHKRCRSYLLGELKKHCDEAELQEFTSLLAPGKITMWNIIGRINPDAKQRVLLMAHWDTRPTADKNPPSQRSQPITGANDGASGVAVLLELARVFSEHRPSLGVDFLLTDGEDYGPGLGQMFLGADYYAKNMSQSEVASYNYAILLDMIGDSNLDIHPERNSEACAPQIYATALVISKDLGYRAFKESGSYLIYDDHLPFIQRGMKVYDFIDFNYDYWHTTQDTVDKCSADSLEAVGRTLENMIFLAPKLYSPESYNGAK
jgi:glutaminyl-peptide cyclotransferase